jgi:gamma-glutamyl:cysteine ligase YbdK (ATP-grasp superfamily)
MISEPSGFPVDLHLFEGFGVELEYMIVDGQSYKVRPIADRLLKTESGKVENEVEHGALAWSNELVLHTLELKTNGPAPTLAGLEHQFHRDILAINERLDSMGARLMPSAVHPFMDPFAETKLWPHDNTTIYRAFDRIFDCRGHGWANLQSVHLNLPFCGNSEFVLLHEAIRLTIPLIPALAAASPFLDGKDTGILDSRLEMYRRNCAKIFSITAHVVPESVGSIRAYHQEILQPIYDDLVPYDPEGTLRFEWTNARGAIARFDRQTIEIRVIDIQECPLADLAILTAIFQLIERLVRNPEALRQGRRLTAERLWKVMLETIKQGEQASITDADYLQCLGFRENGMRANEVWSGLIGSFPDMGDSYRRVLDIILREGTLASRMKRFTKEKNRQQMMETCRLLCNCLQENCLLIP